jgi:hypothetical protein
LSGGTDISFLLVWDGSVRISSITTQRTTAEATAMPYKLN